MFEGDKETFAQAIRNECMCGPDGDLSDWDRTWNEMWQSISQQETCPDKESVEALLEVMLDTRYETDDMDEERSEYLSGLIDRWRSDKEAKQEAVDTISAEVFDDVARDMDRRNEHELIESILDCPRDHEKARIEIAYTRGLNIHAKDEGDGTLLHRCTTKDAIEYLIEKGLDIKTEDSLGMTPVDVAISEGRSGHASFMNDTFQVIQAREKAKEQEQSLRDRAGIGRGRQREHEMSL